TPYGRDMSWYGNDRPWYQNNQKREKVKEAIESIENDLSKGKGVSVYKMNSLRIQCRTIRSHYLITYDMLKEVKKCKMELTPDMLNAIMARFQYLESMKKESIIETEDILEELMGAFVRLGCYGEAEKGNWRELDEVFREYRTSGYDYDVQNYLWMFKARLKCRDFAGAKDILEEIRAAHHVDMFKDL
ncbi:hypothetical protein Tco_0743391, partial [Tanacetum coccineum]